MMDLIERRAAIDVIEHRLAEPAYQHTGEDWYDGMNCAEGELYDLPSAQSEKLYTKAGYIMALHKEYGCSLTRAEEAHNKALEYLQDEMMMKGGKND